MSRPSALTSAQDWLDPFLVVIVSLVIVGGILMVMGSVLRLSF